MGRRRRDRADFAGWDVDAARARELMPDWAGADSDLAWAATRAAELATAAGEIARARMAWEIARQQWAALGRTDDARRAEEALAGPPAG